MGSFAVGKAPQKNCSKFEIGEKSREERYETSDALKVANAMMTKHVILWRQLTLTSGKFRKNRWQMFENAEMVEVTTLRKCHVWESGQVGTHENTRPVTYKNGQVLDRIRPRYRR